MVGSFFVAHRCSITHIRDIRHVCYDIYVQAYLLNVCRFIIVGFQFSFRDIFNDLKRHKDEDLLKGQAVKNQKVWVLQIQSLVFLPLVVSVFSFSLKNSVLDCYFPFIIIILFEAISLFFIPFPSLMSVVKH